MKIRIKLFEDSMKESNQLKEYSAKDENELKSRNIAQITIWKQLAKDGFVQERNMASFHKFATFFNDFRDEHGVDPTIETFKNNPSLIKLFENKKK
ncbi:MAG: hypothetical protein JXI43_12990 [Tissierellales bacterium]|nr:hypothetical protein [Tissierellales bacterium]